MIYMLFNSISLAFISFVSFIFSVSGSLFFLNYFDYNFSISTYVGLIALAGLSIELSIMMIHYVKEENGSLVKKVINGSSKRLRPKIITALTIIFSLAPTMFFSGSGSEFLITVIAPLFFGIIFAFIYALFILPNFIIIFKKNI